MKTRNSHTSSAERDGAVRIKGLNKWFGTFQVLKDINLLAEKGQKIVICGPSGSGKSTLIRCVNGLEVGEQGELVVDGIRQEGPASLEEIRREVGMVFQSFNLFPHMTALQNCMLAPVWVRHMPKDKAEALAMRYLTRVKIPDQSMKYPEQLSGGQQQRVAIARALCMEPRIMLFDEPTSALDPEMIKEVLDVMTDLAKAGMTMLCVSHEMGFARRVADKMVFMDEGMIVEEAPPDKFFENPSHKRTQLFLEQILRD